MEGMLSLLPGDAAADASAITGLFTSSIDVTKVVAAGGGLLAAFIALRLVLHTAPSLAGKFSQKFTSIIK